MNRDRTGPEGKGPRTGRGLGPCTGPKKTKDFGENLGKDEFGRGLGRGNGLRRGRR